MIINSNKQGLVNVMKQSSLTKLPHFLSRYGGRFSSKPKSYTLQFIKISAQIMNNFQKFGKIRNNLIYGKMVKVLSVANLIHKKTLWIMISSPSLMCNLGPNLTKRKEKQVVYGFQPINVYIFNHPFSVLLRKFESSRLWIQSLQDCLLYEKKILSSFVNLGPFENFFTSLNSRPQPKNLWKRFNH